MSPGRPDTGAAAESVPEPGDQFSSVVANIPGAVYRCECFEPWTMHFLSDHVEVLTGYPASDFVEDRVRSFESIIHPDDRGHVRSVVEAAVARGAPYMLEYRVTHRDGRQRWVAEHGRIVQGREGSPSWIDGVILDITRQKEAEEARDRAESGLASVVSNLPGVVYRCACDERSTIQFMSDQVEALVGYPASDFIGNKVRSYRTIIDRRDYDRVVAGVGEAVAAGHPYSLEYRLTHADGSARWIAEHGRPVFGRDGEPAFLDGVIIDITRQKAAEEARDRAESELRHQALHDSLTGLPNRHLVFDRAEQMLLRSRRSPRSIAALFIDLDDFKTVNDTVGHHAGDELLRAVAARFVEALRAKDTVGRLGGDEFVVLAEGDSLEPGPERIAERLQEVLSEPFQLGSYRNVPLSISASIGIAAGPRSSAQEMLRDADIALYRAKASGKGRYTVFRPEMRTEVVDRLELGVELRAAFEEQQYFLVYQPVLDLDEVQVSGVEALLRWRHPTRGVVGPSEFLPMLEDIGMIVPVGRWVLNEACRQAAAWRRYGHLVTISVNVSTRQLKSGTFVDHVRDALSSHGLAPHVLVLEIAESTLMRDVETIVDCLRQLKALGVRIAIDDFGTGYSTLGFLRQFPVDALKIDRSFVAAMADAPASASFVHTFVQLGKSLGLVTLAKGVETLGQLEDLRREHCELGQGYFFAQPVDAPTMESYLEEMRSGSQGGGTAPI